jgi:hypothetical protein
MHYYPLQINIRLEKSLAKAGEIACCGVPIRAVVADQLI